MSDSDGIQVVNDPRELDDTVLDRRTFGRLLTGGGALVLSSSLAGCASDGDTTEGGTDGTQTGDLGVSGNVPDQLILARAGDGDSLDPHNTTAAYSSGVMTFLYDPLIIQDFDGNYHPAVGQGWDISDDGTEWEIQITEGLTFHNGSEVTVDDVVFTYNRFLEQSLSVWAGGSLSTVEKVDDQTARFVFDTPYAPWRIHSASNSGYFGVLPQDDVEEKGESFGTNPVGSGPFQFEEWVQGDHVTLSRNEDWQTPTYPEVEAEEPPIPREIEFRTIPEATPRVQALYNGDVDIIITDVPPREVEDINSRDNTRANTFTSNNCSYVVFNMQEPPTDNLQVRKAFAHAIDRERIIDDIYRGLGQKNWVPMSENLFGWAGDTVRDEIGYAYDPEESRRLLDEAGWTSDGEYRSKNGDQLQIELYSTNTPPARLQTAEEMVSMFADIGVNANLTSFEYNTAYNEFGKGNAHVFMATVAWFEPSILNFVWHSDNAGSTNLAFLKNDEIDSLIEEGSQTIDEEERVEVYRELQMTAMELCPCQPIKTFESSVGLHSRVQNYKQHPSLLTNVLSDVTFNE
jgi:peptide/nickel transport system substrate-binding protein